MAAAKSRINIRAMHSVSGEGKVVAEFPESGGELPSRDGGRRKKVVLLSDGQGIPIIVTITIMVLV